MFFSQSFGEVSIFVGRPVNFRTAVLSSNFSQPLVDVVILESLRGSQLMVGDTITLIGQDGLNCALPIGQITDTLDQIFGVQGNFRSAGDEQYVYPYQEITGCFPSVLQIRDGVIYGPISPGTDSLSLEQFRTDDAYCAVGELPEACFCTTDVRDFCDEAAGIDQSGLLQGIARLEQIPGSIYGDFDQYGDLVTMADLLVVEVLRGNQLEVGDTVSIILDYRSRCISPAYADDFLMLYTDYDETGGLNSPRFGFELGRHPLLEAPICSQPYAPISEDSVLTLAGSVAYDEYLDELMQCVPPSGTENLSNRIGLKVYPNPASDQLTIAWENAPMDGIEFLDLQGRVVTTIQPNSVDRSISLNVHDQPPGVYFVRLLFRGEVAARKVIIRE